MKKVAETFSDEERPAMLEALESWRFPYWDWAAKKPDPKLPSSDYNLPVILPYQGVEIKVPAASKPQPTSFTRGQVWPDPSPPSPGERRQAVTNPFYQFTMPGPYKNMGDKKLGKSAIVGGDVEISGVRYYYPVSMRVPLVLVL